MGRIQKLPTRFLTGQHDLTQAGGPGRNGQSKNGQHHRRFGNGCYGHLTAAAHAAESAAGIQSAQRQKKPPQRQQPDQRQNAAEKSHGRLSGHHRHQQSRGERGEKFDIRSERKNPGGMFRNHHVLAQKFMQVQVSLPDWRSPPVLQSGLSLFNKTGHQRRQQEEQHGLGNEEWRIQAHKAKISSNKSVMKI